MPTRARKITGAILLAVLAFLFFSGSSCTSSEFQQREAQQQQKKDATQNSLEKQNLSRKLKIDEDSTRIGYIYLVNFGNPIGYYTVKGKISSNGSQLTAEDDIVCPYQTGESCQTTDGPQDDGTYGEGDPGIFFFTTEGNMVVTSMDYVYSTQPLPTAIKVPKLG